MMDSETNQRRLTLPVTDALAGRTTLELLRRELGLSSGVVKRAKLLPDGILLDHAPVFTNVRPQTGQLLSIRLDDGQHGHIPPVEGPLDIAHEDEDILILNKPAGIPVHPSQGHHGDTLGNFLAAYFKNRGIPFVFRPVNRLDLGTSGVMVVAKHAHAQEVLKRQLHTHAFRRHYLAVCDHCPPSLSGMVDAPIGRADASVLKREIRPDGAPSRTHYRVVRTMGTRCLVELELETGRTHQIRVHMAFLGCPLTGDFLYGTEQPGVIGRTALHSARLSLFHPITGEAIYKAAPLPFDMARLCGEDTPWAGGL
ncbi:MAG: Ribosomal large subunit pseudouridine synthase [Oscillospiraceae bacterium]|nr:Ribosomal large subunit pseudouridine synthase [Oscillospiraceae bacterium]